MDLVREIASKGEGTLVADAEGEVVGFAAFAPFRRGSGYVHTMEHSIHVLPLYRGQGIGRGLLTRLENVAARQGIHVMVAGISGANPDAVAFHARLGYHEVGRMPEVGRKLGKWLELVLMQKILDPDISGNVQPCR